MINDEMLLAAIVIGLSGLVVSDFYTSLTKAEAFVFVTFLTTILGFGIVFAWDRMAETRKQQRKELEQILELPAPLRLPSNDGIKMGFDQDLKIPIFLPDSVRSRHVHILGATGSGKTESVILNFLRQDVGRGFGSIILDAKGDSSFLSALESFIPKEKLFTFDLASTDSRGYDPLFEGTPLEAAQRLFSSLTWSEEYYKSKAFAALQCLFETHFKRFDKNPTLTDLRSHMEDAETFKTFTNANGDQKQAERQFNDISGLRDQINILCTGHLAKSLSPAREQRMKIEGAMGDEVLYFRLQSLLSPQLVTIVGKLLLNHMNYVAGTAHRKGAETPRRLIPTYLEEFSSFASPEFADLISKARSAGFALHFSHQSIGDLKKVDEGFINTITDNSATKIVLRINDPDSAEFLAKAFGTKIYQKMTHRVSNAKKQDSVEVEDEGTQREAHQFRAAPDLFKTLPTGTGSVLIAHGFETPHGASSVFKIKFPKWEKEERV